MGCFGRVTRAKARAEYRFADKGRKRPSQAFLRAVQRDWRWWLSRRNRRRDMNWDRFQTTTRQDVKTAVGQAFQPDSEPGNVRLESLTYWIFWRVTDSKSY